MNPQDLPLRDIHLPAAVSWWPPAPGWWLMLGLLLLLAGLAWYLHRRPRGARSLQRQIQTEILAIETRFQDQPDPQRLLRELSALLRRTGISRDSREQVAPLTGEAWLDYLDRGLAGQPFSQGPGRALALGPYQARTEVDGEALLALCRQWLEGQPG